MGVQVTFDFAAWEALFPEFSNVTQAEANLWFTVVTYGLHRNDGYGPPTDPNLQTTMLNFALAHLLYLYVGTETQPPSQLVGRIESATQGTVTVQASWGTSVSSSEAFWTQSKYGAAYWQMALPLRTFKYYPGMPFRGVPVGRWPIWPGWPPTQVP